MKIFFIIITIVLFLGCSAQKPTVTEYKIITNNKPISSDANSCIDKSLKVSQSFSSSSLMSLKMDYILKDNKTFSYSQSQWSEAPNRAISLEILKQVRDTQLFKYTLSSKTRSKSDLILESNIEDFVQYYNDDLSGSYANVVISFSIIDARTNDVIASNTFKSKVDTKELDALNGTIALNKALSEVLSLSSIWIGEVCQ